MTEEENEDSFFTPPSCRLSVKGTHHDGMVQKALVEAAAFFNRPTNELYVVSHSPAVVVTWTKFVRNEGEERYPELWQMDIVIGVKSEFAAESEY
jgi:hypothetical protein